MQSQARRLPVDFERWTAELLRDIDPVVGYLAQNEIRFLALMAACPTAAGDILEIGSFKGKSTIVLAKAAELAADQAMVNAVDPMTAPCETDPSLGGEASTLDEFRRNMAEHRVEARVRLHQMLSHELAGSWTSPLRLLWIDGDHTYEGTKRDFQCFAPYLVDRGIVAIHDVLHQFEGGARVFLEQVLRSPNFGPVGFCGSIAWAQFHVDAGDSKKYEFSKHVLAKKLGRLVPFLSRHDLGVFAKKKYKLFRWLIPHGAVEPQAWMDSVV